jgi:hypothetical protein
MDELGGITSRAGNCTWYVLGLKPPRMGDAAGLGRLASARRAGHGILVAALGTLAASMVMKEAAVVRPAGAASHDDGGNQRQYGIG